MPSALLRGVNSNLRFNSGLVTLPVDTGLFLDNVILPGNGRFKVDILGDYFIQLFMDMFTIQTSSEIIIELFNFSTNTTLFSVNKIAGSFKSGSGDNLSTPMSFKVTNVNDEYEIRITVKKAGEPDALILLAPSFFILLTDSSSGGGGGGAVSSVFGRVGAVVAALNDYLASQVQNDSGVVGASVANALDTLAGLIPPAAPVSSVFGRVGAVVAALNDYLASQVQNDSGVAGASVANALDTLSGLIPSNQREIWFPFDYGANNGEYRVRNIGGAGAFRLTFNVPSDFVSLVSLNAVGIPTAGAAGAGKNIDLFSEYALIGQLSNFNAESDIATLYDLTGTSGQITSVLDLSVVFSALSANHKAGVRIDHKSIGGAIDYLGARLVYTV